MARNLSNRSAGMVILAVVWMAATTAGAQEREASRQSGVILHEYFEPGEVTAGGSGAAAPGSGAAPTSRASAAGQPPGLTLDPGPGDLILGPEGPVDAEGRQPPYGPRSPRSGASTLDDQTSRVDETDYHSAFDPSVFPYKRNVVQNSVRKEGSEYGMRNASGRRNRVRVEPGEASDSEDAFWGTFLVDARAGKLHPIPSVAPEQRILRVETEPDGQVAFFRDEADNYYVRLQRDGLVRINARVAAPRFYFRGELEGEPAWSDFGGGGRAQVDEEVHGVVREVARHIGISSEMSPGVLLERLIRHYRGFETTALPDEYKQGDLYAAISKNQIGVCRHRSLAFVVTAQAFGIPARYVTNEAHAFVEVYWPPSGWRRIDLGGAARDIGYQGGRDDRLHDASDVDPFPKPESYREEMRRMRGRNGGEQQEAESGDAGREGESREDEAQPPERAASPQSSSSEQSESDQSAPDQSAPDRQASEDENASNARQQPPGRDAGGGASPERPPELQTGDEGDDGETDPGQSEEQRMQMRDRDGAERDGEDRSEPQRQVRETRLSFQSDAREVFRGEDLSVYGRLSTVQGTPVADRSVEIRFGGVGASAEQMRTIGSVTTDARGQFRTTVTVPETTGIGRWSIVAVFPGDEQFGRATAK